MDNKYKAFMDGVTNLKSENIKKECETLVDVAQKYYSKYDQYQRLLHIKKYLSKSYVYEDNKINICKIKQNQLTPINLLFIELFFKTFGYEDLGGRCKYNMLQSYKSEIKDAREQLHDYSSVPQMLREAERYEHLSDKECIDLVKKTFDLWTTSCQKALDKYQSTKIISLKSGDTQKTLESYKYYLPYMEISEEDSFNEVFSDSYIKILLNIMETNEGLLRLWLAPVRMQLSSHKDKGRGMDNKALRWCFNRDFRLSKDNLDETTQNITDAYEALSKKFRKCKARLQILTDAGIIQR